jgi:hypothetical protein
VDIDKTINFIFKNILDLMRQGINEDGAVLETTLIIELAYRYLRFVKFNTISKKWKNYRTAFEDDKSSFKTQELQNLEFLISFLGDNYNNLSKL